jgi:hypothetical protein
MISHVGINKVCGHGGKEEELRYKFGQALGVLGYEGLRVNVDEREVPHCIRCTRTGGVRLG